MFSISPLLSSNLSLCLRFLGILSSIPSSDVNSGPNFLKAALVVLSLNLRASVNAQEALSNHINL